MGVSTLFYPHAQPLTAPIRTVCKILILLISFRTFVSILYRGSMLCGLFLIFVILVRDSQRLF